MEAFAKAAETSATEFPQRRTDAATTLDVSKPLDFSEPSDTKGAGRNGGGTLDTARALDYSEQPATNGSDVQTAHADGGKQNDAYPPNATVEIDGKKCKTDDNGTVYAVDGKPLPNCEYTLNGFSYKTDSKGRIVKAEGDITPPDGERAPLPELTNKDKRPSDDKGHVIGHQIGGVESEGNLVPQDATLNRGEYNKLEKELAKLKAEGHDVKVEVTIKYKGDSDRPDSFRVKYTVDGKTYVKTFKNEAPKTGGN